MKKQGFTILATYASENNIDYRFVNFTNQTVIILGTKLSGLTSEAIKKANNQITISMLGMVESLNVPVANTVFLFEVQHQRETSILYDKTKDK